MTFLQWIYIQCESRAEMLPTTAILMELTLHSDVMNVHEKKKLYIYCPLKLTITQP